MQKLQNGFNWYKLQKTKNLLAFSAGVDSTALFYMLLQKNIAFDIAIVDYNKRVESKDEIRHAKELAEKYGKNIFAKSIKLNEKNFEANARAIRYEFFEEIIKKEGYETLLTAHHIGDRFEWFLMQFTRGAGAVELCGFGNWEKRAGYCLARPLFEHTKNELLAFLKENGYKHFIDQSNFDDKYERNRFRKISEPLINEYKNGILRSFRALEKDKVALLPSKYKQILELYFFARDENEIRLIAKIMKFFKIVLSKKQRDEIEKTDECVIGSKVAVGKNSEFVFISPYVKDAIMSKEFKELCREAKFPKNVRAYIYQSGLNPREITNNQL